MGNVRYVHGMTFRDCAAGQQAVDLPYCRATNVECGVAISIGYGQKTKSTQIYGEKIFSQPRRSGLMIIGGEAGSSTVVVPQRTGREREEGCEYGAIIGQTRRIEYVDLQSSDQIS